MYQSGYIDLFFADQSGFNMEGYVPYGWQPKGQYIEITPCKTNGIQIWKQDDLYIFFLPKYCPHLSPIEILWRKIKYDWLPYEDIQTQEHLETKLDEILNKFGCEYTINFKEHKVSNIFI